MSNKIIGIKQADGSFFPILNDGVPNNKTLELTTVKDGQTTVKVNLYKQYEDNSELEYVDTLLIQNLVPHKKEEPSFNLSIGVDEDGVLSAEVVDPETGAKSDTTVSLVTLSEAQLEDSNDFGFVSENSSYDFGTTEFTNPDEEITDEPFDFEEQSLESLLVSGEGEETLDFSSLDDGPLDDFSLEEKVVAEETEIEDDFEFDLDDSSDLFSTTDISDEMSLTDDFEADFETESFDSDLTTQEDNFNFGSLDDDIDATFTDNVESDESTKDEFDLSLDMDDDFKFEPETQTETSDDSTMFQDDEIDFSSTSNFDDMDDPFGNEERFDAEKDTVQYADFGEQEKFTNTQERVNPPLFDKKFNEDMAKRQTKNNYPFSTIISIICAIICIIAVIVCFILFAWPSDNSKYAQDNVVGVQPPVVFEKEKLEEKEKGIETIPPKPEENKIEIVEKEEVVPIKPAIPETAISQSLKYRLIWGDTLWDISDTFYRNPWLYSTIADANNIRNPDHIVAGTDILIPMR